MDGQRRSITQPLEDGCIIKFAKNIKLDNFTLQKALFYFFHFSQIHYSWESGQIDHASVRPE